MVSRFGSGTWFVGGAARSGSTLLSGLIAHALGGVNVGELHLLWRSFSIGRRCTCGAPLADCATWSEVAEIALRRCSIDNWGEAARVEAAEPSQRRVIAKGWTVPVPSRSVALRAETERAIRMVTGEQVIVDSSKVAGAAVVAREAGTLEQVVHLVRDPRAVAFSMSHPKPDPSLDGRLLPSRGALPAAAVWTSSNVAFERLRFGASALVRRLLYEEFVDDRVGSLRPLLGGSADALRTAASSGGEHAIAGNPWRFEPSRPMAADTRWSTEMPWSTRVVIAMSTAPLMARYGYPFLGTAPAR